MSVETLTRQEPSACLQESIKQSIYSNFDLDINGGFSLETGVAKLFMVLVHLSQRISLYLGHAELVYRPFHFFDLKGRSN